MFRKLHDPGDGAITIFVDGEPVMAERGESVAAALLRGSDPWTRRNPATGSRRAPYCMMGVCFECIAEVDGVSSVQTCLQEVREGMRVIRSTGRREISSSNA